MNKIEKRLAELGHTLPIPGTPVANYVPYVQSGNTVFISGQISRTANGTIITGRLGEDLTVARGQEAALASGLNLIAQMKAACGGDLSRIERIVKVGGFVCAGPVATELDIPIIINGCSDLLVEVFGDAGRHARFAVASPSLPANCAVEIDAIVQIKP